MKKTVVFFIALFAIVLMSSCATERNGVCYVKGYNTAHQKVYGPFDGKSHRHHAVKCSDGAVFATYKKSF